MSQQWSTVPNLPVPPPLRGMTTAFTEDSVVRRLSDILQRVFAENDLPKTAVPLLQRLLDDIPYGEIRPLPAHLAPDLAAWQANIEPQRGQNWLEAPWFFVETYFYRQIAAAVDHFRSGIDPFTSQKKHSLAVAEAQTYTLIVKLNEMIPQGWHKENFRQLLLADLWGNQADLSMWAAGDEAMPHHAAAADRSAHLLVDDATAVTQLLQNGLPQIDFIIDNAGLELVGDLCLADYLLAVDKTSTVRFHLKLFPTFVSDATIIDVEATMAVLRQSEDVALQQMGERLTEYVLDGRLRLLTHPFWTSPHPLWELPTDLRQTLAAADLLISKGDANYRRALGDAQWPFTTPITSIVSYLPTTALFLRTGKSEVLAGLSEATLAKMSQVEEEWLINGRWGVIQLAP
ncbi:MAG: protein-glutamate O-methyltransferase family protein [Anaerolineaceae bacterium]|nr:protein-glutamate O-methyltransferase family protein [Anaerolineaceae bacterium]